MNPFYQQAVFLFEDALTYLATWPEFSQKLRTAMEFCKKSGINMNQAYSQAFDNITEEDIN